MTREEALEVFSAVKERSEHFKECGCRFPLWTITERDEEAIDMAIEALSAEETMVIQTGQTYGKSAYIKELAEVVRCKDCNRP